MEAVIFDLDNTLYDVEQYFKGSFIEISQYLSEKCLYHPNEIYEISMNLWKEKTSMYPFLFNDLLIILEIDQKYLNNVIGLFNEYEGSIFPYNDTIPTLNKLKDDGYFLGILTDGNPERQKRKIEKLNIESYFDVIIYAKNIAPKPSKDPYLNVLNKFGFKGLDVLYVGDNPKLDFEGAKKVDMITARILKGEFAKFPSNSWIDYEIKNLKEIEGIVSNV